MILPQLFAGRTAFVCASGPSMRESDARKIDGEPVIAVNTTVQLFPQAWVLFACDAIWWQKREDLWRDFPGLRYCIEDQPHNLRRAYRVPSKTGARLHDDHLVKGGSGGCLAIQLAYHMGAESIMLLGFDMQSSGGRLHWHPDHPMGNPKEHVFPIWAERTDRICQDIIARGVPVINLSRRTALTIPRGSL
jgi:hypothetical protein